jgi:hypothetical protein
MRTAPALLVLLVITGCSSSPPPGPPPPEKIESFRAEEIDPILLRNELVLFADRSAAVLSGTMSEIAANTADRRVREQTVQIRIRAIPIAYVFAANPDPRVGFLDMWTYVARLRHYVKDGPGHTKFGDKQHLAIEAAVNIEQDLLALGRRFFTEELIKETAPVIEEAVSRHPLTTSLYVPGTSASGQDSGAVGAILSVPMAPVRGLEGVGGTPDAIDRFSAVAAVFAQHLDSAPERLRWQMELLMLELESLDTVVSLRENIDRLTRSSAQLAASAETLPGDVRAELETLLESSESRIRMLNDALATAETVSANAKATTAELAQAGAAWEAAVDSLNELVASVRGPEPGPDAPPRDGEPFRVSDITRAAEEIQTATGELRLLLADVEQVGLDSAIDAAGNRTDALIDRITYRAILVVAVLIVGLVLYRLLAERVIRRAA